MYVASKPATIIPTNGMFILDEHVDLRTIQIGGTIGWIDTGLEEERYNSYLYLKGIDNSGEIAYLKMRISIRNKVNLLPQMASMTVNKDGKVIEKNVDYQIYLSGIEEKVTYDSVENSDRVLWYCICFYNDVVQYPDVQEMLNNARELGFYNVSIVKQPELHVLYGANVNEY